jgi:SusD family.
MKNKLILFVLAIALVLPSCSSKFMETNPTGSTATGDIFLTVDNALTALNGIHRVVYRQWESTQSNGGLATLLLFYDYSADDIVELTASNGWFRAAYQWTAKSNSSSSDNRYPWHMTYTVVANANMIINNIDAAEGSETEKREIKAQALFYRAYFYFLAVQTYGSRYIAGTTNSQLGIPLRLENDLGPIERSTVEECYAQIFADIDEAISLFESANISRQSKSHLNKYSTYGLKARAALVTGKWQMAADAAKAARGGNHRLMNADELMAGNSSVTNPEWMWGSYQLDDQPLYFYSFNAYMSFNFNSTNIRQCPKCGNDLMYAAINNTDVRKQWWEPNPTRQNMADLQGDLPSNYTMAPLMNRKFMVPDRASSISDYVYMRLSEMYLIEAEALARAGNLTQAQTVLTSFAITRNPSYTATATTAEQLANEVLMQRRIELWGEGFRLFDLKRLNQDLNRQGTNHMATYCREMFISASDLRWQWAIPQSEMNTNELMVQNPF